MVNSTSHRGAGRHRSFDGLFASEPLGVKKSSGVELERKLGGLFVIRVEVSKATSRGLYASIAAVFVSRSRSRALGGPVGGPGDRVWGEVAAIAGITAKGVNSHRGFAWQLDGVRSQCCQSCRPAEQTLKLCHMVLFI